MPEVGDIFGGAQEAFTAANKLELAQEGRDLQAQRNTISQGFLDVAEDRENRLGQIDPVAQQRAGVKAQINELTLEKKLIESQRLQKIEIKKGISGTPVDFAEADTGGNISFNQEKILDAAFREDQLTDDQTGMTNQYEYEEWKKKKGTTVAGRNWMINYYNLGVNDITEGLAVMDQAIEEERERSIKKNSEFGNNESMQRANVAYTALLEQREEMKEVRSSFVENRKSMEAFSAEEEAGTNRFEMLQSPEFGQALRMARQAIAKIESGEEITNQATGRVMTRQDIVEILQDDFRPLHRDIRSLLGDGGDDEVMNLIRSKLSQ